MVKLINWLTGTEMYVAEDRLEEYLKAGHKLPSNKAENVKEAPVKVEKKPTSRKKTSRK